MARLISDCNLHFDITELAIDHRECYIETSSRYHVVVAEGSFEQSFEARSSRRKFRQSTGNLVARAAHVIYSERCEIEDAMLCCVRPIKVKGLCPVTSDQISYRSCAKLPRKSLARFWDVSAFFQLSIPKKRKKNEKHDGTHCILKNFLTAMFK